jgi:hypothetical protein
MKCRFQFSVHSKLCQISVTFSSHSLYVFGYGEEEAITCTFNSGWLIKKVEYFYWAAETLINRNTSGGIYQEELKTRFQAQVPTMIHNAMSKSEALNSLKLQVFVHLGNKEPARKKPETFSNKGLLSTIVMLIWCSMLVVSVNYCWQLLWTFLRRKKIIFHWWGFVFLDAVDVGKEVIRKAGNIKIRVV